MQILIFHKIYCKNSSLQKYSTIIFSTRYYCIVILHSQFMITTQEAVERNISKVNNICNISTTDGLILLWKISKIPFYTWTIHFCQMEKKQKIKEFLKESNFFVSCRSSFFLFYKKIKVYNFLFMPFFAKTWKRIMQY